MADIGLFMELYGGDVHYESNDLVRDDGLATATWLSLFLDKRATPDQLPDGFPKDDLRGYWGDMVVDVPGDEQGSWLWLLGREKTLPEVLGRATEYAEDALKWMKDDSVASSVAVAASFIADRTGWMFLDVAITKPSGVQVNFRFSYEWAAQAAKLME